MKAISYNSFSGCGAFMAMVVCPVKFGFYMLDLRNEDLSPWFWVNLSHLVLFFSALIAFKEFSQVFMQMGWWACWGIRLIVKKILPSYQYGTVSKHAVICDNQLEHTCNWVGDGDLDRLLRKEEETRKFRLARRILRKRRGWMLKSRASKLEEKHLRVGSLRASTCNYLFSPRWNKDYTLGMRQKRAAQSTWRRLRFWMDSNPCLWKCLKTLNITISISDLVSTFDSHPEWFSEEGTCLEAIRAPLQRLGLYISLVPLSSLPHEVLERSGEICSKYIYFGEESMG